MNTPIIIFSICIVIACSLFLGKRLPVVLPQWHKALDHKPFNCRPCFTFHCIWMGIGILSYAFNSLIIGILGIALAFIVFFIVKFIDNKQIEK